MASAGTDGSLSLQGEGWGEGGTPEHGLAEEDSCSYAQVCRVRCESAKSPSRRRQKQG